ncbi:MAG: T9SS type A sorting domain-containing protein, partial [bacterium]
PPCPNDLNGTHKLIKSEPNRRRGGIVVPPIQSDPYDNSKKREAVEISGINGSALVTVYNLMGVKMLETETTGPVKSSSLPSGRYIMQINTGDRIWYEKVIIMK